MKLNFLLLCVLGLATQSFADVTTTTTTSVKGTKRSSATNDNGTVSLVCDPSEFTCAVSNTTTTTPSVQGSRFTTLEIYNPDGTTDQKFQGWNLYESQIVNQDASISYTIQFFDLQQIQQEKPKTF